jgi:hypothetical protein
MQLELINQFIIFLPAAARVTMSDNHGDLKNIGKAVATLGVAMRETSSMSLWRHLHIYHLHVADHRNRLCNGPRRTWYIFRFSFLPFYFIFSLVALRDT